jgi:DNA repair exonuclease SbcCD nuclease subunit
LPDIRTIKILLLADTHLGFDFPIKPRIERRRRGYDFFANFDFILQYAVDNKTDIVVHGGDFFFRTKVPGKIVTTAYEKLLNFAEYGIPILIVPGNHESSKLPESLLIQHRNINVFTKAETLVYDVGGVKVAVSGFPFVRRNIRDKFTSIVNKLNDGYDSADIKLLCMHQAVEGATVGPSNFTFRYGEDVIRSRDLPQNYDCILSGHIHRVQVLPKNFKDNDLPPVVYPGSIERTSFAEKDEDKGFFVIEFCSSDDRWKLDELKFIELNARQMVDLNFYCNSIDESLIEFQLKSLLLKIDSDAIVRINCPYENTKNLLTSRFLRGVAPKTMNVYIKGSYNIPQQKD